MDGIVAALSIGIAVVMLFAQAKLFSIDSTLKDIREELKKANGEDSSAHAVAAGFTKLGL